jgi:hypothetical protein
LEIDVSKRGQDEMARALLSIGRNINAMHIGAECVEDKA